MEIVGCISSEFVESELSPKITASLRWGRNLMNKYVYILHFDKPFHHARHYIGSANNVAERVAKHTSNPDVKMLIAALQQGITFTVARTFRNNRVNGHTKEYRIKRSGGVGKQGLCPICNKEKKQKKEDIANTITTFRESRDSGNHFVPTEQNNNTTT